MRVCARVRGCEVGWGSCARVRVGVRVRGGMREGGGGGGGEWKTLSHLRVTRESEFWDPQNTREDPVRVVGLGFRVGMFPLIRTPNYHPC